MLYSSSDTWPYIFHSDARRGPVLNSFKATTSSAPVPHYVNAFHGPAASMHSNADADMHAEASLAPGHF